MKITWLIRRSALCFAAVLSLQAQVPQVINYQGRVLVGSTNFNGTGQFRFALVDATGSTTYWSNDGTSTAGSPPTNAVLLSVSNGLYSMLLGDTSLPNMTNAIPASVFNNNNVRLRVWFDDGTHGVQLLSPDQRIAAVGYAVIANNVVDGAITSAKIANGAVGSTQLAANAVQGGNIASGAVGSTQLAANAVQSGNVVNSAITSAKLANGAVGSAQLGANLTLSGTTSAGIINWGTSSLNQDQGGSIELGNSLGSGTTPFIDFHYGAGANQDFNVRLINDASGGLSVAANRFSTSGDVGIRTSSPSADLHVVGTRQFSQAIIESSHTLGTWLHLKNTSPGGRDWFMYSTGSGNSFEGGAGKLIFSDSIGFFRMTISTDGNVGIGTATPGFLLHVNGNAGKPGGGSWSNASDVRLKKNIRPLAGALDKLLALHGVNFEYIDPEKIHELSGERMGLIAQEVEKVLPDWVDTGADGYKRVTVRGLEALVVEALRELREEETARAADKEREIEELRNSVRDLQRQVEKLAR